MKEANITAEVIKRLKKKIEQPRWVCKFNDNLTAGIPDFCVVVGGVTTWFEMKTNTDLSLIQDVVFKSIQQVYVIRWNLKNNVWFMEKHTYDGMLNGKGYDMLVDAILAIVLPPDYYKTKETK